METPTRLLRSAILAGTLLLPTSARAADGGVYLYLQPLGADAGRITFSIAAVTAIDVNGSEHALTLHLTAIGQTDDARQRLLASARLPIGSYAGLTFTIARAALKRDGGTAALTVPETVVPVNAPFTIAPQHGTVVWLTLRYPEPPSSVFTPVFSAGPPPQPIADHTGFVTNFASGTITVFDKHIGQVVGVLETCAGPAGMALDQRRRRLFVACSRDDELQSIDVATGEIVERTRVSPGDRPREVALTPDGLTLVSVNTGSSSVSFFDAVSLARRERVNVGSDPRSLVIDPSGRRVFVCDTLSSTLSVIEIASRTVVATVSTEAAPLRAQFSRSGDRLYVIHERSPFMTVLDARQLTLATRARLRTGVSAIAVDTVRDLICIGGDRDATIEFYDPNALMPLYAMKTRDGASYLAFDAEDNSLYIVATRARRASVARLSNRKVVSEIDVGEEPYAVSVMGER